MFFTAYTEKHEEAKWRTETGGGLLPRGRYTIEDYRNLKKNWAFGRAFGKIKNFDNETREEKVKEK